MIKDSDSFTLKKNIESSETYPSDSLKIKYQEKTQDSGLAVEVGLVRVKCMLKVEFAKAARLFLAYQMGKSSTGQLAFMPRAKSVSMVARST